MNDRYRNERNRGESDWRERVRTSESGWREGNRQPLRAEGREPQYSSDEDETYGSEWTRGASGFDRDRENSWDESSRYRAGGREDQARFSPSRGSEGRSRGQSHVGHYGSGGRGGYSGGYAGGGWGGSSGTSYERGDWNQGDSRGLGPSQGYGSSGGYGQNQGFTGSGSGYGGAGFGSGAERGFGRNDSSFGQGRGFGGGLDQGYRSRDFGSPGADLRTGGFAGRGPKGYTRTDDRIREDVCERLSQDDDVDASEIEVSVKDGEVTLRGTVITRGMKHDAEDIAEKVSGVRDVHNELRVMKGMLSELKDKLTGDERNQHFAGSGTKNSPTSGSASRSS